MSGSKKEVRDFWDEIEEKIIVCESKVDPTLSLKEKQKQFKGCMQKYKGYEAVPKIVIPSPAPPTEEEVQEAEKQITRCQTEAAKALAPESKKEFEAFCYSSLPPRSQEVVKLILQGLPLKSLSLEVPSSEIEERSDLTVPDTGAKTAEGVFQVHLPSVRLIPILDEKIYVYNHYQNLKENGLFSINAEGINFTEDAVLMRQLKLLPKVILLFLEGLGTQKRKIPSKGTIVLIDPVGQMEPIAERFVYDFFKLDYNLILKTFIHELNPKLELSKIELSEFEIKVCISHIHPDHWTGISSLIQQLRAQHYTRKIQIFVPDNVKGLLRYYEKKVLAAENQYVIEDLDWSREVVQKIRELCYLYYGKFAKFIDTDRKVEVVPIPQKKDMGLFRFESTKKIHAGTELLFRHLGLKGDHLFLDDIFPPTFALGTTLYPKASYANMDDFYKAIQKRDFCFWSHVYPFISQDVAKGRFIRPYFRDLKKWIKANAWTPYTTVRRENRGKSEKEVFQEFFKKWVANEKGIALGILKDLFFEVDEAKIGRIIKIVQTINEAAIRSDTTIEIKWTDHPSKRYRIIETIAIAWTGTSHDFNPLEFQTAVLVIGFLINILQYCELRYKTRSKR